MKLRLRGSSIRLRLTRKEVGEVAQGMTIKETLIFPDQTQLHYVLQSKDIPAVEATFKNHQITVTLPPEIAKNWAQSEDVSLKYNLPQLSILIEKDFACLKVRTHENEDESELFFNPNTAKGHC